MCLLKSLAFGLLSLLFALSETRACEQLDILVSGTVSEDTPVVYSDNLGHRFSDLVKELKIPFDKIKMPDEGVSLTLSRVFERTWRIDLKQRSRQSLQWTLSEFEKQAPLGFVDFTESGEQIGETEISVNPLSTVSNEKGSIVSIKLRGLRMSKETELSIDSTVTPNIQCYVPGKVSYLRQGKDPAVRDEFNPVTDPKEVELLIQGKLK